MKKSPATGPDLDAAAAYRAEDGESWPPKTTHEYAQSYIDSVFLTSSRLIHPGFVAEMRQSCGTIYPPKMHTFDRGLSVTMALHQPSKEAIARLADEPMIKITGVQVALDLVTRTFTEADRMQSFLRTRLVSRSRNGKGIVRRGSTDYFGLERHQGPNTGFAMYAGKPSKPSENRPCAHLEIRVRGAAHLRRLGLRSPEELISLNHTTFWKQIFRDKHLELLEPPAPKKLGAVWLRHLAKQADGRNKTLPYKTAQMTPVGGREYAARRIGGLVLRLAMEQEDDEAPAARILRTIRMHPKLLGKPNARHLFKRVDFRPLLPPPENALWTANLEKS